MRPVGPAHMCAGQKGLEPLDVDCLRALGARLLLIGDLRALGQRAVALGGDRGVVDEEVAAALVRRDEAESLLVAEPLDCSCWHVESSSGAISATTRRTAWSRRLHLLSPPDTPAALRTETVPRLANGSSRGGPGRRLHGCGG